MRGILSENIKELRIQNGINQVSLAKALNVSKQCVSNWENDNVQPSVEMLIKLADYFHVSADVLIGRASSDTIDVSFLTSEQRAHLRVLAKDFTDLNKKVGR